MHLAGMRLIGMHLVGENIIVVGCEEFRFSKFGKRPFFVTIPHRTLVWLLRKFVSWLACLGAASPHRIENSNCNFIVTSNPGARHSIQAAATYSTSIADLMLCDSP